VFTQSRFHFLFTQSLLENKSFLGEQKVETICFHVLFTLSLLKDALICVNKNGNNVFPRFVHPKAFFSNGFG